MSDEYVDHRRNLAYWALPTDRRLPLAFLGRTLEELLRAPFRNCPTRRCRAKKMCSFVKLLGRAANTDPSELPADATIYPSKPVATETGTPRRKRLRSRDHIGSRLGQWRASVVKHQLGAEKLVALPRVCRT